MGIPGLSSFIQKNDLFNHHKLHDTVLIIDGSNLVWQLYFRHQHLLNNHMFGGDYSLWSNYAIYFFKCLLKCNVKPIVIYDGSLDPSLEKLKTKLKRLGSTLNTAYKIYEHNFLVEGIKPMMIDFVFCQLVRKLQIPLYQTVYEADDVISRIASDLSCPILSNDSDFFLQNLPGGVIPIHSLITNFEVQCGDIDGQEGHYVQCSIYRAKNLTKMFPGMNLDLIQISGFLLGNDYVDQSVTYNLLAKMKKYSHNGGQRQKAIYNVLKWISHYGNYDELIQDLTKKLNNSKHVLIECIRKHFFRLRECDQLSSCDLSVEEYFVRNLERLFLYELDLPSWLKMKFVERRVHNRILLISKVHMDWFSPLVEDFSFLHSSYECTYDLCQYIYGLLRDTDLNIPRIKRYARKNKDLASEQVKPFTSIGDHKLPQFSQLEHLSQNEREDLFYAIIQIDRSCFDKFHRLLLMDGNAVNGYDINDSLLISMTSMLIGLLYLLHNFPHAIWLEFVYALFCNLLLSGHFCPESTSIWFRLDLEQRKLLHQGLHPFCTLPTFSKSRIFMPRIVHYYNAYQACLVNLDLLSDILNVKHLFDISLMTSTLRGTFIYNLTAELASRPKPLLYIEQTLGRQKFKPLHAFINLVTLLLEVSGRTLVVSDANFESKDVLPPRVGELVERTASQTSDIHCLVRAFQVTNKKTHIKSQQLKLKK